MMLARFAKTLVLWVLVWGLLLPEANAAVFNFGEEFAADNASANSSVVAKKKRRSKKSRRSKRKKGKKTAAKHKLVVIEPLVKASGFDAASVLKWTQDVLSQTKAFSKVEVLKGDEENPISECGGIDETICLCGMSMELEADFALYMTLTAPKPDAPAVFTVVLADVKNLKELKRVPAVIEDRENAQNTVSNAVCVVLERFGCKLPSKPKAASAQAQAKPAAKPEPQKPTQTAKKPSKPQVADEDILYAEPTKPASKPVSAQLTATAAKPADTSVYLKVAGWTTFGIGAAGLVGFGTTWLLSWLRYQDYQSARTSSEATAARDDTELYSKLTWVLGITGGVLVATGATLVIVGEALEPEQPTVSVAPTVSPRFTGLQLRCTF